MVPYIWGVLLISQSLSIDKEISFYLLVNIFFYNSNFNNTNIRGYIIDYYSNKHNVEFDFIICTTGNNVFMHNNQVIIRIVGN